MRLPNGVSYGRPGWRTRGRPHPVYIYGGFVLVALKLLNLPISMSAGWHAFAGEILTLAQ